VDREAVVEFTLGCGFGCGFGLLAFFLVALNFLRGAAFFFFGPLLPLPITILIAPFQLV
jgi:hypothetical protein